VRWAICKPGSSRRFGRGRGVNRSTANPLQIDILTNVVLPIEVDEVTTWNRIQPSLFADHAARGAVPFGYADNGRGLPRHFVSRDAARMALTRENPEQMPIESSFRSLFRVSGNRVPSPGCAGPAGSSYMTPPGSTHSQWLTDRIGDVVVV